MSKHDTKDFGNITYIVASKNSAKRPKVGERQTGYSGDANDRSGLAETRNAAVGKTCALRRTSRAVRSSGAWVAEQASPKVERGRH